MRTRILGLAGMAVGLALACSGPASADPIVITDPVLAAHYTLPYGDFNVVSLGFAVDGTGTKAYYVPSSPGQLKDAIVVGSAPGTGFVNGSTGDPSSVAGIDSPYNTDTGKQSPYFRTGNATTSPDPGGAAEFTGDTANSWDIRVDALQSFLGAGNVPVLYFNLNENGTDDILSGTDLLIWLKITLTSDTAGVDPVSFYVAGGPFDPAGPLNGRNLSDPLLGGSAPNETASYPDIASGSDIYTPDPRWTYVHGDICVSGQDFIHYGSCDGRASESAFSSPHSVKQNLGANQAAFAAYSIALNDALATGDYDTLQIDWRMADLDNGYEQLFIYASGAEQHFVPEPLTITLFGAGLAGLGLLRRRKARKSEV